MKAIVVSQHGGPEVLQLCDVPDPRANAGEVLVRVEAAGVNFADVMMARGSHPFGPRPPYLAGLEFAGTDVDTGERAMGICEGGAFAERIAVRRDRLFAVPKNLSTSEAAAFPGNYFTAYFIYHLAHVKPRERVLIHAAAGGVGTAAIELGNIFGVETFGTSSSDEKLVRLKELGLDHGINYSTVDYEEAVRNLTNGQGVDVVFDALGGDDTVKGIRCLRHLGRVVVYGLFSGRLPEFDFFALLRNNISVLAFSLVPMSQHPELMDQAWQQMSEWLRLGKLRPIVGHQLPLAHAADGLRLLVERRNYGKVVLKPQEA